MQCVYLKRRKLAGAISGYLNKGAFLAPHARALDFVTWSADKSLEIRRVYSFKIILLGY